MAEQTNKRLPRTVKHVSVCLACGSIVIYTLVPLSSTDHQRIGFDNESHCTDVIRRGCLRGNDDRKARRCSFVALEVGKGNILEHLLNLLREVLPPFARQLGKGCILLPPLVSPRQILLGQIVEMVQRERNDFSVPAPIEKEGHRETSDASFGAECPVLRADIAAARQSIKDIAHCTSISGSSKAQINGP